MRRLVALAGLLSVLLCLAWLRPLHVATEPSSVIGLQPGRTVVTWSGAEPYAISNFAGTPVTQIHRFDPVRQEWLSHFIGQDDPTLPELHLLPRVQYLLASDAAYELAIPSPLAGIDPLAALRMLAVPDDPLRFEAYWPNEDSPLEDLVVLRGEDERLSVKAWVAGGVGDVSVFWMIDGRVNHVGENSDNVPLTPGAHNDAMVFAASLDQQVVYQHLPRIVKLPPLELPSEMTYGIFAGNIYMDDDNVRQAYDHKRKLLKDAGFGIVRSVNWWPAYERSYYPTDSSYRGTDSIVLRQSGIDQFTSIIGAPTWATTADVSHHKSVSELSSLTPVDLLELQEFARTRARLYPDQRFWQIGNEPNLQYFQVGMDPHTYVEVLKAAALGIWYERPTTVIILGGITGVGWLGGTDGYKIVDAVNGGLFLDALYQAGAQPWFDIAAIHYANEADLDKFRRIMAANGDDQKHLWVTETGLPVRTGDAMGYARQAEYYAEHLPLYIERADVHAAVIFMLGGNDPEIWAPCVHRKGHNYCILEPMLDPTLPDGGIVPRPAYWAVREIITGQPPPTEE